MYQTSPEALSRATDAKTAQTVREFMKECVKQDWYIALGGVVTFKNAVKMKVDDNTYKIIVEEGEILRKPQNPIIKGYTSQGWFYDVGENSLEYVFSDSQKVYSDLNLTINSFGKLFSSLNPFNNLFFGISE